MTNVFVHFSRIGLVFMLTAIFAILDPGTTIIFFFWAGAIIYLLFGGIADMRRQK